MVDVSEACCGLDFFHTNSFFFILGNFQPSSYFSLILFYHLSSSNEVDFKKIYLKGQMQERFYHD
jgi:hypothetical protein